MAQRHTYMCGNGCVNICEGEGNVSAATITGVHKLHYNFRDLNETGVPRQARSETKNSVKVRKNIAFPFSFHNLTLCTQLPTKIGYN